MVVPRGAEGGQHSRINKAKAIESCIEHGFERIFD
jgi:hypothetical protein